MKNTNNWEINSKIVTGIVCGKSVEVAVTEFRDKYFVLITDCGKIGSLIQVQREKQGTEDLCNSKVLFGKDEPEIHAVACALSETSTFLKPVVFGLALKDYSSSTVKELQKLLGQVIENPAKETVPITDQVR